MMASRIILDQGGGLFNTVGNIVCEKSGEYSRSILGKGKDLVSNVVIAPVNSFIDNITSCAVVCPKLRFI